MAFFRKDWITLPIYVPRGSEVPAWHVPSVPMEAIEPIHIAMELANEMDDYATKAIGYKLLILRSQEPKTLIRELSELQKTVQGDRNGQLQTCLSSYIGCTSADSQKWLSDELANFDPWNDGSEIRDPEMYWAMDFIQRSLALNIDRRLRARPTATSTSNMGYYAWLPTNAREFVNKVLGIEARPEVPTRDAVPLRSMEPISLDRRLASSVPPSRLSNSNNVVGERKRLVPPTSTPAPHVPNERPVRQEIAEMNMDQIKADAYALGRADERLVTQAHVEHVTKLALSGNAPPRTTTVSERSRGFSPELSGSAFLTGSPSEYLSDKS